jgi:uncharacterized protein YhjY with autotransporter beta-barrel domain
MGRGGYAGNRVGAAGIMRTLFTRTGAAPGRAFLSVLQRLGIALLFVVLLATGSYAQPVHPAPTITRVSIENYTAEPDHGIAITVVGTARPGSTIDVYFNEDWPGGQYADSNGDWSFSYIVRQEGPYDIYAIAHAPGYAPSQPSATVTVPGTFIPDTLTASPNAGPTSGGTSVTITGEHLTKAASVWFGNTPATGFTIQGDAAIIAESPPHAQGGPVVVSVRTADGNDAYGSAQFTYVPAPNAPVIEIPEDASATRSSMPHFSGTAAEGDSVSVFVNGSLIGTTQAEPFGYWALRQPTPLADGTHTVYATASHIGGTSPPSNTVSFTIDTVPPPPPTVLLPADNSSILSQTPTITGTADAGLAVDIRIDGTLRGSTAADADGAWSFTSPSLSYGTHTVAAQTRDEVGNLSSYSNQNSFVVLGPITVGPTAGALADAEVGTAYAETFTASGGSGDYTFAVTLGALPDGLDLDAVTGALSGTPTTVETASFNITATDAALSDNRGSAAYTIAVLAAPVSDNAELASLLPSAGTLDPGFDASTFAYQVDVANDVETITLTPTAADANAGIAVNGQAVSSGFASQPIALAVGSNPVRVVVTAEDGTTTRTYTVTVTRAAIIRPDPSLDPEVIGLLDAQADTATRFAQNQITNFHRRLEQLHNAGGQGAASMDVRLGFTPSGPTNAAGREIDQLIAGSHAATAAPQGAGMPGMLAYGPGSPATLDQVSPPGPPDFGPLGVWSGGFVNFGERGGALDLDYTMIGVSGGIDYRFSDQFVGGFGVGYGRDRTDIGGNGTQSRASAGSAALYGSYRVIDNLFVDGLLGGSWLDFDSRRFVTANGEFATGNRNGAQLFGSLSAAYEFRDEQWLISPYGRAEFSRSWLNGFTETGGGIHGLTYGDQTIDTLSTVLGIRANYAFNMEWGVLTPGIRAEYMHDFSGSSRASLGYADLGGLPYAIDTAPTVRDFVTLGLSLDMQFANDWNLGLDYRTGFGGTGNQDHTLGAKLGVRF